MSRELPTQRTTLYTYDGRIVVRPKAPDSITSASGRVSFLLSEEGKRAWDEGKPVLFPDHVCGVLDLIGIQKAEF